MNFEKLLNEKGLFCSKMFLFFLNENCFQSLLQNYLLLYRNTIICTWGSDGVAALDDNDQYYASESFPPDTIVDSLGAGDTFVAATIYGICCEKLSLMKAITFASYIAGAKVGFYGYDNIEKIYKGFLDRVR